ncbi:MAG: hypothetical protein D3908_11750 [Candidatus Electrothrix sp. AUS4]|nr:hypothetical protein [Candidatus Electrothrix sp. AUS4]
MRMSAAVFSERKKQQPAKLSLPCSGQGIQILAPNQILITLPLADNLYLLAINQHFSHLGSGVAGGRIPLFN